MSTTQDLKILVVEDNETAIRNYRAHFTGMGLGMPQFVKSFNEAQSLLSSVEHFDLVILDLCIPEMAVSAEMVGLPAPEGIQYGLRLKKQCLERDENPIPGLVIITGKLAKIDQSLEREKLEREFACGKLVLKSQSKLSDEIEPVIERTRAFNRQEVTGEQINSREIYLVRRLALHLEYQGFELSLLTKQPTDLQAAPFAADGARMFIGKPILEPGKESSRRYYLAFIEGDSHRLDAAFEQAKQWAESCPHVSRPERFQSNRTALLWCQITLPPTSTDDGKTIGERRTRVCELIIACIDDAHIGDLRKIATLAKDLAQFDAAFQRLDEGFVRKLVTRKAAMKQPWATAARLTRNVLALEEEPAKSKQEESKLRRKLTENFRVTCSQKKAARGKKATPTAR